MNQTINSYGATAPRNGGATGDSPASQRSDRSFAVAAPKVELPKGGGAVRGIGEKFAASPASGTGSLTVPIATSPGRAGFGPQLSLAYDSGSGNGPFGFGWSLGLPHITRKTDKGLPLYDDAGESDVFLLTGAEDLVPVLAINGGRFEDRAAQPGFVIHSYRPRIEGLFARIERWTRLSDGDVHWRSISKENVLTVYGKDAGARIADPDDRRRVFSWLICETRDDKGHAILYDYKSENGDGVDLRAAHERNRGAHDDPRRTVNRYIKRIRYGSSTPLIDGDGRRPDFLSDAQIQSAGWLFEVVFDYGEHDLLLPRPGDSAPWDYRPDAFSSCRAGFEVRTTRRCRRVLTFHHFEHVPDVGGDCLVKSTDFVYVDELGAPDGRHPIHSFLHSVTQSGYRRQHAEYLRRSLPPLAFEYSIPVVQGTVQEIDASSLAHLPAGLDGGAYLWTDLHGEGIPGLLTEQGGAWHYKRNLSSLSAPRIELAPSELVAAHPNFSLGVAQLVDLAGDGTPDLVIMEGPTPGVHEHDAEEGWKSFRPFTAHLRRGTADPNLRLIDLDGDGRADALITEDDAFVWHGSLGGDGFGPARRVAQALHDEAGPRLVFSDPEQSIFLADMNADGLTDLVRIRNGEVCYWPQLGYGRFGAKVSMDGAPHFDRPECFDQRRIRIADVDGSGAADLVYLAADGVTLYFNQSGNSLGTGQRVASFPAVDNVAAIQVADLMGNGTACLVWSSPLPGHATRPMRYVDLMGGHKPHLLTRVVNNLGAETAIRYTPSTKFYLADKLAGRPWLTKIPFPVHVVEQVETFDRVSGSLFVTRYAYHHGYFDGVEREFRGFAMVEQFDTEEYAALGESGRFPVGTNIEESSHVPPVLTRTWFHTGMYLGGQSIANVFAGTDDGDAGGYYRGTDADVSAHLDDTVLPQDLSLDEEREACRAVKGAMLRQEVYGLDGSERTAHPYVVTEQNFTVRVLQRRAANRHGVFLTHARETITRHYERNPDDPRVTHALTLEADDYGNVRKSAAVSYGRRQPSPELSAADRARQAEHHITCTERSFTNAIDSPLAYRAPLPAEVRTYELAGIEPRSGETRVSFERMLEAILLANALPYEHELATNGLQKRLIEHLRTLYRPDDLGATRADVLALLPLGRLDSLAVQGESYTLAFSPGLVARQFGGKVDDTLLTQDGRYVHVEADAGWWRPAGRVFFSPNSADNARRELAYARRHFFQPLRFRDPFHSAAFQTESTVTYDTYDLAVQQARDALGNVASAHHDYRVLQPRLTTDPNGNRAEVAFDALGMVIGTAVMGKDGEGKGDSLLGFVADLDEATQAAHLADPLATPDAILQRASTRIVYDLFAYARSRQTPQPQPAAAYAMARETHDADVVAGQQSRILHTFSYSDGFGREIQKKAQAEPGPLSPGGPSVSPRWVGSGWTVFNNKEKPVRQYEPFFSSTHRFEFARIEGVSPVLCYDPVGRVVVTLRPNHTWETVVFDSWQQETWDANDTVLIAHPQDKPEVADYFRRLAAADYLPGWHAQRAAGAMGTAEQDAAAKAALHGATPLVAHLDSLGRSFLSIAHNRFKRPDSQPADPPEEAFLRTRIVFDIEGNECDVVDAIDRVVVHADYDMLGNRIHSLSMDGGERWTLNDVAGRPRYAWDGRHHRMRTTYDALGRQSEVYLRSGDRSELLAGRTLFGESQPDAEARNLRGKTVQMFDGAGVVVTQDYDFKGNALSTSRQLAADYTTTPDWSSMVPLGVEVFTTRTTFDALNRAVTVSAPDSSIIRHTYNEASLLEAVDTNLRGEAANGQPVWTPIVTGIAYNSKAQREHIAHGNGAATTYEYDPLSFRLKRQQTRAGGARLQDLSYTHDAVGNITRIEDAAQQAIYFRNRRADASNDYLYDAVYQLIEATGREHLGQRSGQANAPTPPDAFNRAHTGREHPGNGNAMGSYVERYRYDEVGNVLEMQHTGSDPAHPGWTRSYTYSEPSATEETTANNRLSATRVGSRSIEPYTYDAHGNTISMPHLSLLQWNHRDQLEATSRQVVNSGTSETTYYVYDSSGERVRKVTARAAAQGASPVTTRERIYLPGYEIYRTYSGGSSVNLERQTVHVMDGAHRVALVETRAHGDDGSRPQLIRYQIGNHLASSSLELDDAGEIISYEEYYPYGSTSYQAVNGRIAPAAKRYRFTDKERDEETGLAYHGARYYIPWLGRWSIPDPAGVSEGINVFRYVHNRPTHFVDPTGHADQPADKKTPYRIPVKPGFVKESDQFGGLPDFAADPAVTMLTPEEFDEESVPNVQVFHVVRDLAPQGAAFRYGPGAHSFALVVIKDPTLFNPLTEPRFAGRLNFQDTVDEDSEEYATEVAPELLETGEGRFYFTVGAYNANRPGLPRSTRYLDVKINEQTDRVDAIEFIFNRVDAKSSNANGALGYRIEGPIPMEQLVDEMLELSALYESTGVTIVYPSKCENALGLVVRGPSNVTNSNSYARSVLMHAGATNTSSDMGGADTGMDVLIPKSTFLTGVANQPIPWSPSWCPF